MERWVATFRGLRKSVTMTNQPGVPCSADLCSIEYAKDDSARCLLASSGLHRFTMHGSACSMASGSRGLRTLFSWGSFQRALCFEQSGTHPAL